MFDSGDDGRVAMHSDLFFHWITVSDICRWLSAETEDKAATETRPTERGGGLDKNGDNNIIIVCVCLCGCFTVFVWVFVWV